MIYTVTALVFLLLSLYLWDNKKRGNRVLVYAVLWLIIFEGFRWEIGTDWDAYYNFFLYGNNDHMGLSYTWLNEFVRKFTESYTAITLLVAVVTYATLFILLRKYSPAPIMSILIIYCGMMGILGSNRQFLAMLICKGPEIVHLEGKSCKKHTPARTTMVLKSSMLYFKKTSLPWKYTAYLLVFKFMHISTYILTFPFVNGTIKEKKQHIIDVALI